MVMKKGGERERVSKWGAFYWVCLGERIIRDRSRREVNSRALVPYRWVYVQGQGQVPWRQETPRDYRFKVNRGTCAQEFASSPGEHSILAM